MMDFMQALGFRLKISTSGILLFMALLLIMPGKQTRQVLNITCLQQIFLTALILRAVQIWSFLIFRLIFLEWGITASMINLEMKYFTAQNLITSNFMLD